MSGSLLGPDQVKKLNAAYPALVAHVRELLTADHSAFGLMKVHLMVESFDSDEMAKIFRDLSFISPMEKRSLVRAAVYELVASQPALFITPATAIPYGSAAPIVVVEQSTPKVYTPPQFSLNVNRASDIHGKAPADTPPPTPIITSTHSSKVSGMVKEGAKQAEAQQAKLDAAVAKLREASAPAPIEIPVVPEDATLPQE